MSTCFVIQPFDRGIFDKRYEDVFKPAIKEAGLDPYRVDEDPAASIPIDDIEHGIRRSELCFAEITTDNPNVWFELGYAIAAGKEVVLIRSAERKSRFPFDIQHRKVIVYKTESQSDFVGLRKDIVQRIKALLEKEDRIGALSAMPVIESKEGLSDYEIVTLVTIAQSQTVPGEGVSAGAVKRDCEQAGYTGIAVTLALRSLIGRRYIDTSTENDGYGQIYSTYAASDLGLDWLEKNKDLLVLRRPAKEPVPF
jgi:hypothetical protein